MDISQNMLTCYPEYIIPTEKKSLKIINGVDILLCLEQLLLVSVLTLAFYIQNTYPFPTLGFTVSSYIQNILNISLCSSNQACSQFCDDKVKKHKHWSISIKKILELLNKPFLVTENVTPTCSTHAYAYLNRSDNRNLELSLYCKKIQFHKLQLWACFPVYLH